MFLSLRNRLILIGVLVVATVFALIPRKQTIRERGDDGIMRDSQVTRTPIKYGLDLQGGMHLGLELDQSKQVSADPKRDIDLALTVLRKRIDEFGVTEPLIQKVGDDRIVVELAGVARPGPRQGDRAAERLPRVPHHRQDPGARPGAAGDGPPAPRDGRHVGRRGALEAGERGRAAPRRRLGQEGGRLHDRGRRSRSGQRQGGGRHDARDGRRPGHAHQAGRPAGRVPTCRRTPSRAWTACSTCPRSSACCRAASDLRWCASKESLGGEFLRALYVVDDQPIVTGANLIDARAELDPLTNGPQVSFELDRAGGRKFGEGTGRHVGDFMAIVLDGRVQGRPPVIQSRIDRNGRITLGGKTLQEAQDLALTLKAGALPIPLKIVEQGEVGASLGSDSIRSGLLAGRHRHGARHPDHGGLLRHVRRPRRGRARPSTCCSPSARWRASTRRSRCRASRASCSRSASRWTPTC